MKIALATNADQGEPAPRSDGHSARTVLDDVDSPVASTEITLASGRRYELVAGATGDQVTVRGRGGEVVLRIGVTDEGPILSFSGATLDLVAARRIRLAAEEVCVEAARDLSLTAGGSLRERVGADHHTRVTGNERLEASNVELQANTGSVSVQAMHAIALDGEHIGLNDRPAPEPFPWSEIAGHPEGGGGRDEPSR
jgi:uncharacterized protein (DUF2345 family)